MIRAIALDLDDTLLAGDQTISPANREAVEAARAQGVEIVLATARGWFSTEGFYRQLNLSGYAVCGSGTKIYDRNGRCVKRWTIPLATAKRILAFAERERIMMICSAHEKNLFTLVRDDFRPRLRPQIDVEVPGLADWLTEAPTQLFVKGEREVALLRQFLSEPSDEYRVHTVTYRDGVPEMMIIHPEANKGTGLAWVCETLGIRRDEVMAAGDSSNDIPMIEWAGIGVAMGWAPDAVKAAADHVTDPDDPDGVATAIRRFVLT